MADKYSRPCFDSSVFLGGLKNEISNGIKRGVIFRHLWSKAEDGEFKVFISSISLAEVYKKRKAASPSAKLLDEFLELINRSFVEVIEVDREVGLLAHALCRRFAANKLMPNDAIHLACALRAKCDVLLAWDGPLTSVKHENIEIAEPAMFGKTLLSEDEHATEEEIKVYDEQISEAAQPSSLPIPAEIQRSDLRRAEGQPGAEIETGEAKGHERQGQEDEKKG